MMRLEEHGLPSIWSIYDAFELSLWITLICIMFVFAGFLVLIAYSNEELGDPEAMIWPRGFLQVFWDHLYNLYVLYVTRGWEHVGIGWTLLVPFQSSTLLPST